MIMIILISAVMGFVLLIAFFLIATYNKLVTIRQRVRNSWAQVDVQLKRRYDLIPNLVNTVKGYASHERETLENVIKARSMAVEAGSVKEQSGAENMLTGALRQLLAVSERYPDLKADGNFRKLQDELTNTEEKIAFSRQFYNDIVMKFNTAIQRFPTNIIAGMFGFHDETYFNLDDNAAARQPVNVEF